MKIYDISTYPTGTNEIEDDPMTFSNVPERTPEAQSREDRGILQPLEFDDPEDNSDNDSLSSFIANTVN